MLPPRDSAIFETVQIFSAFPGRPARRIGAVRLRVLKKKLAPHVVRRAFDEHVPVPIAAPPRAEKTRARALRRCQMASGPPQERRIPAFGLAPIGGCMGNAVGGCMAGSRHACLIAAFAAGFAAMGRETPSLADDRVSARQEQVCGGDEIARGTVGRILDGRTFMLEDGREVRLAAIEVAPPAGPQDRADPAGRAAAAALGALAAGDQVVLRRAEGGSDRYGRLLAYAYTLRDADEFLLQRELVAEGLARVSTRIARPCSEHLLDREKAAREAKLGLWAEHEVLNAEAPN